MGVGVDIKGGASCVWCMLRLPSLLNWICAPTVAFVCRRGRDPRGKTSGPSWSGAAMTVNSVPVQRGESRNKLFPYMVIQTESLRSIQSIDRWVVYSAYRIGLEIVDEISAAAMDNDQGKMYHE